MSDTDESRAVTFRADAWVQSERQQQRQRAALPLPTDRMKIELQIKVLQTQARLSGPGKRAVNAQDLSRAVGAVAPTTVILSHRFFRECGWVEQTGRGQY